MNRLRVVQMSPNRNFSLLTLLFFLAAGCLGPAKVAISAAPAAILAAPPAAADAGRSFNKFCQSWLSKLAKRERDNKLAAKPRRAGSQWVLEYVGYAKKHDRCEAKATGKRSNPFIGKMVYTESKFRAAGDTRESAKRGSASVISRTEIMEIFRFDGKKWVY